MPHILNIISVLSAFVFGAGCLYLILNATVGKIKALNSRFEWNGLQIKDFIFLALSIAFVLIFFELKKPF